MVQEQLKGINNSLKEAKAAIEEYTNVIDKERKRLEKASESKREETQQKMEGARAAVASAEETLKAIQAQRPSAEAELARLKDVGSVAERKQQELRNGITSCEGNIQNCVKADKDRYAAYGNNIQRVVQQISQTNWHGQKPLGPFGIHVKVRDNKWAELLRFMLAGLLSSFAVTDTRDIRVLKKILADNGKYVSFLVIFSSSGDLCAHTASPKTVVHFFTPDLFDYSNGEPQGDVMTVLRALEVSVVLPSVAFSDLCPGVRPSCFARYDQQSRD